jgi:membrane-bound serine protease (ClpP class)
MIFLPDPNFAFVLLAIAFMVTIFALLAPGTGILEAISLILLTLVGFSMANLAVNTWAILLLVGGIVAVLLALKRSESGYLLASSIVLLLLGMLLVFKGEGRLLAMDPFLAIIVSISTAAFIWIVGRNTAKAFQQKPQRNLDKIVGQIGKAVTDISKEGSVYVGGENWSAESETLIKKGSPVIICKREGLLLKVEPYSESSKKKS